MAYSPSKFLLTHLLQDAWKAMGQSRRWKVTGGSATTVVNSAWAGIEDAVYEDNDFALVNGTAIVAKDSGGLGASPEGRYSRISSYDAALFTLSLSDTLTDGVVSGDLVTIASPMIPLEDMIELANDSLRYLGDFDLIDTSVTIAGSQTEYTLPSVIRQRPLSVQIQTVQAVGNNQWEFVNNWDIRPATAGADWVLVVPPGSVGHVLSVKYRILHPEVASYDSPILETIHPDLAVACLTAHAFQWMNNKTGGTSDYWIQRENKAWQDLEIAKVRFPIEKEVGQVRGFPHWGNRARYVPLTSDLKP